MSQIFIGLGLADGVDEKLVCAATRERVCVRDERVFVRDERVCVRDECF